MSGVGGEARDAANRFFDAASSSFQASASSCNSSRVAGTDRRAVKSVALIERAS